MTDRETVSYTHLHKIADKRGGIFAVKLVGQPPVRIQRGIQIILFMQSVIRFGKMCIRDRLRSSSQKSKVWVDLLRLKKKMDEETV